MIDWLNSNAKAVECLSTAFISLCSAVVAFFYGFQRIKKLDEISNLKEKIEKQRRELRDCYSDIAKFLENESRLEQETGESKISLRNGGLYLKKSSPSNVEKRLAELSDK